MSMSLDRRKFLLQASASLGVAACAASLGFSPLTDHPLLITPPRQAPDDIQQGTRSYTGPNVILIRFGGGVRRLETISDPERTYCPFIYHELARRKGILFSNVEIADSPGVATSHGEGTLYILTGEYRNFDDVDGRLFGSRFEPQLPTLFEYLRKSYDIPAHQALIVNGEDRIDEEFYTFSNNSYHDYGVRYKATVLSLFRFKMFLLRERLAHEVLDAHERYQLEHRLQQMEQFDYRVLNRNSESVSSPELDQFWRHWRDHYGSSGLVNPRGDRLLTTIAIRALRELRPKLMMINYQDPDYVHWGNPSFYTRGISIIDEGVREIYEAVQNDHALRDEYHNRTVFVIVPDCGRDNNRCMSVPFQHHFNTPGSHQIFTIVAGPEQWVPRSAHNNDRPHQQISVTKTIGKIMGFRAEYAQADSLFQLA
jgi:hypothetical protein